MKFKPFFLLLTLSFFIFAASCNENSKTDKNNTDSTTTEVKYPEKIKSAVIYEVNIRQYSPEGTFNAFTEQIPRLADMGVDILWLMPVFPVGEKNRKGDLGSYYAVQNYTEVNPEFGTKEDLAKLIKVAHENNMLVILDWVANHTAWDNVWIDEHPDWYTHDDKGNIIPPVEDWSDVADLNYDNQEMRAEMLKSLEYWVTDFDVDGFRCDVAMMVPTDFWENARIELDKIKPMFMLAESETDDLMVSAFDMNYSWELLHITQEIAKGELNATDLIDYIKRDEERFSEKVLRMTFTSNHDENSWNGSVYERFPDCYKTFAALTFVVPGMPLIYSGQEACLDKRLAFFYKDTIDWKECEMAGFYKDLIKLKDENEALWNGELGAPITFVNIKENKNTLVFIREQNDDKVLSVFNLSANETEIVITDEAVFGKYKNYFSGAEIEISVEKNTFKFNAWDFWVLIAQ
ncbi:MAG: alpha-amylase [Bacteroidales bacterium]|nr:alpha-amylase [Bacteroidales bacterium]